MPDSTLARQFIEFAEKGFATTQAVIGQLKKKLDESNKSAELLKKSLDSGAYAQMAGKVAAANAQLDKLNAQAAKIDLQAKFGKFGAAAMQANDQMQGLSSVMGKIGGTAAAGFAILTGTVMGFVRAGLAGTVEGFQLQFAFQMLSREIAGVFMPIVDKVISFVQKLTGWFKNLSMAKQDLIMKLALAAAGGLLLISVVGGLIIAVLSLTAAMVALDATLGGIPLIIGIVVTAIAGVIGAAAGFGAIGVSVSSLGDKFKPVIDAAMAFGRMLEQVWNISVKLYSAISRPFEKFFNTLTGGKGFLDMFVAGLEVIANFVDDYIMPAFEQFAAFLEAGLTIALRVVLSVINEIKSAVQALAGHFESLIPPRILAALQMVGGMFRTGAPGGGEGHRRPAQMDTGFESSGIDTWKRISQEAMKTSVGGKDPAESAAETAEHMANVDSWTQKMEGIFDEMRQTLTAVRDVLADPSKLIKAVLR